MVQEQHERRAFRGSASADDGQNCRRDATRDNIPLPIGFDKTISQPFVVALMTDLLDIQTDDTVLEIGTGLGYLTAILAELASKVFTIEIIDELGGRRDNGSADRTTLTLSSRSAMAITVGLNMLPSIK